MPITALILATIAALLHVLFWVLESLRFGQEPVWRRFGVKSAHDAEVVRTWAFNQGFYNLFLAIGTLIGVGLSVHGRSANGWTAYAPMSAPPTWLDTLDHQASIVGSTLIAFGLLSMLAAAAVLFATNRTMARAAAIQGVIPGLALLIALAA